MESATENKPPGLRSGKGEKAVQETTVCRGNAVSKANPARSKIK